MKLIKTKSMDMQSFTFKLGAVALISLGLNACSMLPSTANVFIDEKENYKKAHELPPLELPPELRSGYLKDEYDGGVKDSAVTKVSPLKTTPLSGVQPAVELIEQDLNSRLLMRDSLRNTWRKTISALEELDYDIEDKNRETGLVFLNIPLAKESESMLSGLSFWKSVEEKVYVVALDQVQEGVTLNILNEEKAPVSDAVSVEILSRLLAELGS